ncbi:tripartite tricarboxylate transporter substrate binding protein [Ramlibacter sp. AW1]|uniref:Tripartite tricarboxylate transporter substrate binding protein n=1 Tax=Ramlibacter aurantiacus TaxID=2801330 RepID=A0A936ZK89_9BURK|nr:tripartite tricarboxylate transporter substrate binding protein [Ramlibacter aurantiacus]MBL0422427.1 tripartite tricarboxylate transporter substrate binding protein [Ramlibacter aurantiacus]
MKYLKRLAIACSLLAGVSYAVAQEYPVKPVKIIVGYVPGGGPDMVARGLATRLSEILGQPFVVENKPGAGAVLATAHLAKLPADGYNLLLGETGQLVIAPHIQKALPYDTLKDLAPIARVTSDPMLLVANAKAGIGTLPDLIRSAKAKPGAINYGSSGVGTIHHIVMEVFKADAGLNMTHVPYKGSGQSLPAVLAGDVPVAFTTLTAAGPHLRSGTLVPLATTSARRLADLPEVPAIGEFVKGYEYASEVGILAPAGVPPNVVDKLASAIKKAVDSPEFIAQFKNTSISVTYGGPSEYAENLRASLKKYERAVKLANIKAD